MWRVKRSSVVYVFTAAVLAITVFIFRFYRLGAVPQGVTKDESYYGYDAYSILKTGRDIWGNTLPLFFKSTGEYKLNLTYFVVPAVKAFGLSEFAVRLPSAVFGFMTLGVLFLTLRHLLGSRYLSLILTASFALSPWSYGMSRLFYESNVGLFFVAGGIYAILRRRLFMAAVFLALSAYLYNPYRYIGLIVLLAALGIHTAKVQSLTIKRKVATVALYAIVLCPLFFAGPGGVTTSRLKEEWLLRKSSYEMTVNDMRATCLIHTRNEFWTRGCYPLWNKAVMHVSAVSRSFVRSVSPEMLFLSSDNEYIVPKEYGMYLSYLLPFYLLGIIWLSGFVRIPRIGEYVRYIMIIGIIASAGIVASTGTIEFYREPVLLYLVFIVISVGTFLGRRVARRFPRWAMGFVLGVLVVCGLFQTAKYLVTYHTYTYKLPLLFASDVREIYEFIGSTNDYMYIVDRKFHGPITAAFFWGIDPARFQNDIVWTDPDPWGFINAYRLDTIYSQTYTIEQLLCKKHADPDVPIRAVVIDDPGKYTDAAALLTRDYTGSLTLHAVYDIDVLYPFVKEYYPGDLCRLPG